MLLHACLPACLLGSESLTTLDAFFSAQSEDVNNFINKGMGSFMKNCLI